MIYIVSYDCDGEGTPDYANIAAALDQCGVVRRFQQSVCLVSSELSAIQIRDAVKPSLGPLDTLFVARLEATDWAGWRTKMQAWIRENRDV